MRRVTKHAWWVGLLLALAVLAAGGARIWLGDQHARTEQRRIEHALQRQPCSTHPGRPGHPIALLTIPAIHVRLPVINGTAERQLNTGAAGRVRGTGMPGRGNLALAAHVVSAGNPFRHLAALRPGDLVLLRSRCGTYTYVVSRSRRVRQTDVGVLRFTGRRPELTLITCWPATYFTTPWRTVITARLDKCAGGC